MAMEILSVLTERDGRLIKKLRIKENSAVLVMENGDGCVYVLRIYRQEIPAYRILEGHECESLPAVYHCEIRDGFFMVQEEYIEGICLQDMLDWGARLDEKHAVSVVKKVSEALAVLHDAGYVHRDVKPEHVILMAGKRVVLIDLDASMRLRPEKDTDTRLLGTAIYAAPEQFGLTRSDVRTDIYAVGILLNEMLTGVHPAVTRYRQGRMGETIETCIQMNPQDRYQSVKELADALSSEKAGGEEKAGVGEKDGGEEKAGGKEKAKTKKWKRTIAACAAGVVILFGAVMMGNALPEEPSDLPDGAAVTDVDAAGVEETNPWLQLYKGKDTVYYNFRQGSQTAKLRLEDGTAVDETFDVYVDPGIGVLEGWDAARNAWRLTSEGCDMGAEGYLHAEKDGKHYAIRVVVMGEPISAYSSIPSMDDLTAGYLKPAVHPMDPSDRTIYCTYDPAEKTKLYLAAMFGFDHLMPECSDSRVTIHQTSETGGWPNNLFIMTFENPEGGTVNFQVSNQDTRLKFVFEEE
ncbi:MAG: serine/threonine protein kinase [Anaerovoracaceae bacterium]